RSRNSYYIKETKSFEEFKKIMLVACCLLLVACCLLLVACCLLLVACLLLYPILREKQALKS
ncbi:MAG: hypothetical protein LBJ36_01670, partial [Synergistaceae bacterium]|nr:hypothetical protein [Synergistaceae bacterium]